MLLLLAGESSEVPGRLLHTSFGSRRSSTTIHSASRHHLTVPPSYWMSTFGLLRAFRSPVQLCGTLYQIVSVTHYWVMTFFN